MAQSFLQKKRQPGGSPAWIVTFADLATLLLTFFILLLSFAEMDVEKYRAMAASMVSAFTGQTYVAPSAGEAPIEVDPSTVATVPSDGALSAPPVASGQTVDSPATADFIDERDDADAVTKVSSGIIELASRLVTQLEQQVAAEDVTVNYDPEQVVIRFAEEAAFQSGQAEIKPEMVPILDRVVNVLSSCEGDVVVAGYTDDRPITSSRFRSNWDLSAARAVSVVHQLVLNREVPADRVMAAGRAETNPLVPNDSAENRARNRRVEISIRDPRCEDSGALEGAIEILP